MNRKKHWIFQTYLFQTYIAQSYIFAVCILCLGIPFMTGCVKRAADRFGKIRNVEQVVYDNGNYTVHWRNTSGNKSTIEEEKFWTYDKVTIVDDVEPSETMWVKYEGWNNSPKSYSYVEIHVHSLTEIRGWPFKVIEQPRQPLVGGPEHTDKIIQDQERARKAQEQKIAEMPKAAP